MKLLERASFLQTLAEYAGEARQGDGRLVLVSGESGIGKTALVEMFQQRAKGARWLWGACDGLLSFLGRRLGRMTALLLATYRDDELGDDHPLRVVLGDLATQRATRRMRLPRLSEEARRSSSGHCGSRMIWTSQLWRRCTRASRASIRCSIGGKRRGESGSRTSSGSPDLGRLPGRAGT